MPLDDLTSYSNGIQPQAAAPPVATAGRDPTVDPGGTLDAAVPPSSAEPEAGSPPLVGPARVLQYEPPEGAVGVAGATALTITFAQPMSTESVQGALESSTLPLDSAEYDWSNDDTVLRIAFPVPLAEAEGSDVTATVALCYNYRITSGAHDATGRGLEPSSVSFCTRRNSTRLFSASCERDLSGNWRSDGIYGDGDCAREARSLCVGDSGFAPNQQYRGFLTFDLSSLNEPLLEVTSAKLQLVTQNVNGQPFTDLGALLLEGVRFRSIGRQAFASPDATALGALEPTPDSQATWLGDATASVRDDAGGTSQYRLRFASASDQDDTSDHLLTSCEGVSLQVRYAVP